MCYLHIKIKLISARRMWTTALKLDFFFLKIKMSYIIFLNHSSDKMQDKKITPNASKMLKKN